MVNHVNTPDSRDDLITRARVALWAAPLWGNTNKDPHWFYRAHVRHHPEDARPTVYTTSNAELTIDHSVLRIGIKADRSLVMFYGGIGMFSGVYAGDIKLEDLSDENLKAVIEIFSAKQSPKRGLNRHRHNRRRRYRVQA